MTTSLLDVLSCGLAVVVILLMIALNTGKGFDGNPAKISAVEVEVVGDIYHTEQYHVKWNEDSVTGYETPVTQKMSKIGLGGTSLDSLNDFFQSNLYLGERRHKEFHFLFHPESKGMELSFTIDPTKGSNYQILARLTNVSKGKNVPRVDSIRILAKKAKVAITYNNGVRLEVRDEKGKVLIERFLKNTK